MPLRMVHTGDVHLGAKFLSLGERGVELRKRLLEAFERSVDLALERGAQLFVIAGDLFDSPSVSITLKRRVASSIKRLIDAGVEVCLVPGTHDRIGERTIYDRPPFQDIEGLNVFTADEMVGIDFPHLDLTVYGHANTEDFACTQPLEGFSPVSGLRWRVGVVHASVGVPVETGVEYEVKDREIEESGLDYLALGHWHSVAEKSRGDTVAYYCGSPEGDRLAEGEPGKVLLVELDDEVKVTPIPVGKTVFREVLWRGEAADILEQALLDLEREGDPDAVLRLVLEGIRPKGIPDSEEIRERLGPVYFWVDVVDRTKNVATSWDPGEYPHDSAEQMFVKALLGLRESAGGADSEMIEAALSLGLSYLEWGE